VKKKSILFALALTVLTSISSLIVPTGTHAFAASSSVVQTGDQTGDVWDIQYRLKVLGYYTGSVDGIYGWNTTQAVCDFQSDYGLTIDGTTGYETLRALKRVSVNQDELDMMAHMIYAEARGESYEGQVAVGAVIMNRLKSPLFPNTIAGVLFQPGAFSSIDDGQYWLTPNQTAYQAALDAVKGWDPSGGALYYFNPNTATSSWIWTRPQLVNIGNHIFTD
jgi:N-acetylmuramoyl-L-alanine amidase